MISASCSCTVGHVRLLVPLSRGGLHLVGLDIIGDFLTEVNVTSPTCFKEYKELCDIDVAQIFIESIEEFSQ